MLYLESLNNALHEMMSVDPQVILVGEDLLDPYGGAFKVSRGLSTNYPKQVISTPISEQAIIGASIGMSMRGMKPIVEIMFGDFITLCVDQIVNHATKYHWMYNEQVKVPIVIRTPMGGGRGYGPTHSQSLESIFMSVSGIRICAPSIYHNPGFLLKQSVLYEEHPVLFVENKASYPEKLFLQNNAKESNIEKRVISQSGISETLLVGLYLNEPADIVLITYGGLSKDVVDAALHLFMEEEILAHVIIPSMLREVPINDFIPTIKKTGRVLLIEEGNKIGGWGAEVASQIQEYLFSNLRHSVQRIGAKDFPIPASRPLEKDMLPTKYEIINKVKNMV